MGKIPKSTFKCSCIPKLKEPAAEFPAGHCVSWNWCWSQKTTMIVTDNMEVGCLRFLTKRKSSWAESKSTSVPEVLEPRGTSNHSKQDRVQEGGGP